MNVVVCQWPGPVATAYRISLNSMGLQAAARCAVPWPSMTVVIHSQLERPAIGLLGFDQTAGAAGVGEGVGTATDGSGLPASTGALGDESVDGGVDGTTTGALGDADEELGAWLALHATTRVAISATANVRTVEDWANIGVASTSARGAGIDPSIDLGFVNATHNDRTAAGVAPATIDVAPPTVAVRAGRGQRPRVASYVRRMS